ncbi:thioredoxin-like protein [Limtongia smithiae]|uniref:thioredoxin-like protein n=1 Tax=Limtongia smithiae TaxID=1125753 RepID=UPI0034CD4A51
MDAATAAVVDSYKDNLLSRDDRKNAEDDGNESLDDDDFLELLEDDTAVLDALRERRMQELSAQMKASRRLYDSGYGRLTDVSSEKELMDISSAAKYSVVHFYQPTFRRCLIMKERLESLTAKHMETRFLSINVDTAPFLVVKLKIQILPCVICFIDGKEVLRLVGFEALGNSDNFTSSALEFQLQQSGVITSKLGKIRNTPILGKTLQIRSAASEDGSDDDWD